MEYTSGLGLDLGVPFCYEPELKPKIVPNAPPNVDRLSLLNPRSPTFVDDAIEFVSRCLSSLQKKKF